MKKNKPAPPVTPPVVVKDYTLLLNQIIALGERILSTINDQKDIVAGVIASGTKLIADEAAKLAQLAANQTDPAVAQGINDTVANLTAFKATLDAADAALNAPPAGDPGTGGTPTP